MLQLGFFRNVTFCGANLVGVIISFGFFGVIFFLSLFMQEVQGYRRSGPVCCSCPGRWRSRSPPSLSGRIVGRVGSRLPMSLGMGMLGAGCSSTALQPTTPYSSWWYWLVLSVSAWVSS